MTNIKLIVFTLITLLVISTQNTVKASLIEADYLTLGDNLAVYDEDTGVTWLEVTLSTDMGYEEALSTFEGYRVATIDEVEELFINYFGDLTYNSQGVYYDYNEHAITKFIELFGATEQGFLTSNSGIYLDESSLKLTMVNLWENAEESNDGYLTDIYGTSYSTYVDHFYDDGAPSIGFYLIKDSITQVDEGHTFSLLFMALILLIMVKSRRNV